jgi:hypothetical protein
VENDLKDGEGNFRVLKRVYDDGIDRDNALEQFVGPARRTLEERERDEERAAADAWAKMTGLQRFIAHGKGFLCFVGFSFIFAISTKMIHVPLRAIITLAVVYVITLVICLRS